ncbi:hypothetical protein PISMIDRAFT_670224, partial [Pisolithus microcarpus 441]
MTTRHFHIIVLLSTYGTRQDFFLDLEDSLLYATTIPHPYTFRVFFCTRVFKLPH